MNNFRRPAVVSLFTLLVLLLMVPSDGKKKNNGKRCPVNKNVKFPSVLHVYMNVSEEFQWQLDDENIRSLSPWIYSFDENYNRFPSTMKNANCHGSCVDSKGNVDLSLDPAPIKQEILVLLQEVKGCKTSFKLKTTTVSVGCTCVRH